VEEEEINIFISPKCINVCTVPWNFLNVCLKYSSRGDCGGGCGDFGSCNGGQ
jgi:hypothetical protein